MKCKTYNLVKIGKISAVCLICPWSGKVIKLTRVKHMLRLRIFFYQNFKNWAPTKSGLLGKTQTCLHIPAG